MSREFPDTCRDCRFWVAWSVQKVAGRTLGDCRRHAPTLVVLPGPLSPPGQSTPNLVTRWPGLPPDSEACGDGRLRPSARPADDEPVRPLDAGAEVTG